MPKTGTAERFDKKYPLKKRLSTKTDGLKENDRSSEDAERKRPISGGGTAGSRREGRNVCDVFRRMEEAGPSGEKFLCRRGG